MSSLSDFRELDDVIELSSDDDSAWEDCDSDEDEGSLRRSVRLEGYSSSEETELSDNDLEYDPNDDSENDSQDNDFPSVSRERNRFPEDPFMRPPSPRYFSAPKRWPPKFREYDMVFFKVKNKKPEPTDCYRVSAVNKDKKTYQLKKCSRPSDKNGCPLLYKEEDERQIKRKREIRKLPGGQQQAAFDENKKIHNEWVEEYKLMLAEDEKQDLHENGAWYAEKLLDRWDYSLRVN